MQRTGYINAVIPYIERHLGEELNPQTIAGRHFVSLSRLYRDFCAHTGHSIKEYIRKRRISNACEKIKCSDMPLSVIADESGCQTVQAFHKQFKSVVGLTPLAYRGSDAYYCFYPFSPGEISVAVKVSAESIPECTTTRFYDSRLVGIEDRAIASLGEINGRVFGRNGKQTGNRFCYEIMLPVRVLAPGIPISYATCTVNYNEREIDGGWNYLYNTWLPASMFEQTSDAYFEEYLFRNGKPHRLKLYLPVKKRGTVRHITISRFPERAFLVARESGKDAERRASEIVMSFARQRFPLIAGSARRFYVCRYDDICECGVECPPGLVLPAGSGVAVLCLPPGRYAVLSDDCLGDTSVGVAKIDSWLKSNAISCENGPVFAVYETVSGLFDPENIRLSLQKQLEIDRNG